ncbi:hypothetical protein PYCCODRAFT_1438787 [Trametes coccinea BRFM310]|uniref:Secreted protein n=1 Tax=Trametes coccinea (strain BRFM310) TaxID=1353009 RepID=A0A1Y2ICX8_TRAC3|nr:hypothetical protein PYCCODRAFT_1438787 [Trametes coccinea BRFM310]
MNLVSLLIICRSGHALLVHLPRLPSLAAALPVWRDFTDDAISTPRPPESITSRPVSRERNVAYEPHTRPHQPRTPPLVP